MQVHIQCLVTKQDNCANQLAAAICWYNPLQHNNNTSGTEICWAGKTFKHPDAAQSPNEAHYFVEAYLIQKLQENSLKLFSSSCCQRHTNSTR